MSETIPPGRGRKAALRKALRGKSVYVMAVGFGEAWVRISCADALYAAARIPDQTIRICHVGGRTSQVFLEVDPVDPCSR